MLSDYNTFFSNIESTSEPVIVGIDEAGRGPVIGPLVYGLYIGKSNDNTAYKDSKVLTKQQREMLFNQITKNYKFAYIKVHPIYITTHMESGSLNLNEISRGAVIKLLKEVQAKCSNVQAVYIDGLGNNQEYERILKLHFNYKFIIENKADSKYQVVSGASIVAKVTRDEEVDKLNCGSGYPSDPITKNWLQKNKKIFGFPNFVRHSWGTVKKLIGEKKDLKLFNRLNGFYTGPN